MVHWRIDPITLLALARCINADSTGPSYANSTISRSTATSPSSASTSISTTTPPSSSNIITNSATPGLFPLPASGNGSDYNWYCNRELSTYSYLASSGGYSSANVTFTTWATDFTASTTTLCDGRARIVGTVTPVASSALTSTSVAFFNYTGPPPSCSIAQGDCTSMWSLYKSASSSYDAFVSSFFATDTASTGVPGGITVAMPECSTDALPTTTGASCGACTLYGGSVQLLYFPHVPDSGPYVVSGGHTFYQNKAYISFQTAYASNTCGAIGSSYAGGIVGLPSSQVYSVSGYHFELYDYAYQVNFADFNDPIPASAYLAMYQCSEGGNNGILGPPNKVNNMTMDTCNRGDYLIYDPLYAPQLAVPPQFRDLDPAWSNCLLSLDALWDPPKALQPASAVAAVTTPIPAATTTTTASPVQTAQTPATTTAAATITSIPSPLPESKSSQSSSVPHSSTLPSSQPSQPVIGSSQPAASQNPASSSTQPVRSSSNSQVAPAPQSSVATSQPAGGNSVSPPLSSASQSVDPAGVIASVLAGSSITSSKSVSASDPSVATTSQHSSVESASTGASGGSNIVVPPSAASAADPGTTVVTVGSSTYKVATQANSEGSSAVVVAAGSSTVTLVAGQATSIGGQPVSAPSSGGAVIGSSGAAATVAPQTSSSPAISVVVQTNAQGSSAVIVAISGSSVTLAPGGTTKIGGQAVSAPSSGGAVIGTGSSATTIVAASQASQSISVEAHTNSQGSSVVVIAQGASTVTLIPGQTAEIGGEAVSAPSSGGAVIGSGTAATTIAASVQSSQSFAVAAQTNSQGSSAVVIAVGGSSATLTPGQTTMINGQTISAPSTGGVVLGSGAAATTIAAGSAAAGSAAAGVLPVAGSSTTALGPYIVAGLSEMGSSGIVVAVGSTSVTLAPGASTMVDGQEVSALSFGGAVVESGTHTLLLGTSPAASGVIATVAGQVISIDSMHTTDVVIGGQTLTPGEVTTISGAQVSLATGAIVVNGTTIALSSVAAGLTTGSAISTAAASGVASPSSTFSASSTRSKSGAAVLPLNPIYGISMSIILGSWIALL
ncbi:hypothetical protein LTR62_001349 [Meristemomyces frigidus]|uniref:Uncharacterized protein n=1 Tax=Meristemomyces frigidus TaxID=1508187 RepID=A0AAN7YMF7_9PEZI|nr:hypothetical protein LTR62_001349 [Meristemomyces frigidus]